jgi:hypothetical protein
MTTTKRVTTMKKIITIMLASLLLSVSGVALADSVIEVWTCTLNDGKTAEESQATGKKWVTFVRELTGNDEISSSWVSSVVGDEGTFLWVDSFPSLEVWAATKTALDNSEEYAPIGKEFGENETCSGNRLYSAVVVDQGELNAQKKPAN